MPTDNQDDLLDAFSGRRAQEIARAQAAAAPAQPAGPTAGDRAGGAVGRGVMGAKVGFSNGGPIGAAIGGIAGAVHGAIDPKSAQESEQAFNFTRMANLGRESANPDQDKVFDVGALGKAVGEQAAERRKRQGLGAVGDDNETLGDYDMGSSG